MATANLPAPLFPLLQQRDGLGPFMVAVVFAAYAAGVIASLALLGGLSDRLGRRRVLVAALGASALGTALLACCAGSAGLIAGRILVGLATGLIPPAATAFLVDLDERARAPADVRRRDARERTRRTHRPRHRTEAIATAANLGGLGGGPLLAGLLATGPGDPLVVPFAVFAVLTALAAVALLSTRETVAADADRRRALAPIRIRAGSAAVRAAWAALFAAYAVQAFFSSLAPGLLADAMDRPSPALAGAVTCLLYVSAAASQLAFGDRARRTLLGLGVALLPAGVALVTAGVWRAELALVLAGGALAGTGIGALTRGCIATVTALAPPAIRGEALSGLFLAGYVGLCLPVLGLGLASDAFDPTAALAGFSALIMAAIAGAGRLLLRATD